MKSTRLFHTLIVVGASLTAGAPLAATVAGCTSGALPGSDEIGWRPIAPADLAHGDLAVPPDLGGWTIIDASIDWFPDLARRDLLLRPDLESRD